MCHQQQQKKQTINYIWQDYEGYFWIIKTVRVDQNRLMLEKFNPLVQDRKN